MIKITVSHSLLSNVPILMQRATEAFVMGAKRTYNKDSISLFIDDDKLTLEEAFQFHNAGVVTENMSLFIEINSLNDEVPVGLPNATYLDEDDETIIHRTWSEWMSSNHHVLERGDRLFVGTNANSRADLPISDLISVFNQLVRPSDLPQPIEPIE